ncbi:MAG: hypothetical protein INF43_00510 [Alphaproteobacteria bacterium]|nr:hypothetical protein [Alphaproteobacteria bacterium]
MADTLWLWLALASSLISAQNVEMNRRAKQEGFRLNLWRMGLSAMFWLPLALLQPWPSLAEFWPFYLAAAASGMALIVGFTIQNDLALQHNGRVAVLHMPLKAVVVFLLWALCMPEARAHYFENWATTLGVMLCLGVMAGALFAFRKNDISWASLQAVLPIVGLYAAADIFTRLTMPTADLQSTLIVFLFVMTSSSVVASLLYLPWRPRPELSLTHPKLVQAAGWAAVGGTLNQVCFFAALILGPSPAYVSMVALLTPVWLLFYHRIKGIPDNASPLAGTALVLAAVVLMYLVA